MFYVEYNWIFTIDVGNVLKMSATRALSLCSLIASYLKWWMELLMLPEFHLKWYCRRKCSQSVIFPIRFVVRDCSYTNWINKMRFEEWSVWNRINRNDLVDISKYHRQLLIRLFYEWGWIFSLILLFIV